MINKNSFIPALEESEKFVDFLNKHFKLNLPNNYVITINKTSKTTIGYFMNKDHKEKFINEKENLNNINLNTFYLKTSNPYEVLTHELAHFINYNKKVKDVTSNQYHNKHFKKTAEMLLLVVEKGKRGYSKTKPSPEFDLMIKSFKKNEKAFTIFQNRKDKASKVGSRNILYTCKCKVKVRCATKLNAKCLDCNNNFKKVVV